MTAGEKTSPIAPGMAGLLAVLGLLLLVMPWLEGGSSPAGLFITHTLVFLLLALALLRCRREGRVTVGAGWEAPAAFAALAIALLSFCGVDYFYGSFLSLWNLIATCLFAAAMALIGERAGSLPAAAIGLASAAEAVAVFVMPAPLNMTPSASFANANQLAAYLDIGVCVAIGMAIEAWRRGSRARAAIAAAVAAADLAALARLGSRGAMLGLLFAGALGILLSVPAGRRRLRLALWGGLAALSLIAVVSVAWRFHTVGDPYRFDRVRIWKAGVDATRDHPMLGLGPGMFERRAYRYNFPLDREMFRYSKTPGSTHSTWLDVAAQTGLSGLAAALLLAGCLLARLASSRRIATGPGLALTACLVQGFADTPFEVPAVTFSLIALLVPWIVRDPPQDAALFLAWSWPRMRKDRAAAAAGLALAATMAAVWAGVVLQPYRAWTAYLQGRLDDAVAVDPANPLYHAARAESVWRRDRPLDPPVLAAADRDLREAHRLDPGSPEHLLRLAQLHARACFEISAEPAARARAERYYRQAIALGSKDPRPHLELAAFLLAQSRAREGIEEIHAALALEPRYVGARVALVKALEEAGMAGEAAAERERVEALRRELASYAPKNGYERDLMRAGPGPG